MKECKIKIFKGKSKKGNDYCKVIIYDLKEEKIIYENFIPIKEYNYYAELIHTL